jgi:hypothetical protein
MIAPTFEYLLSASMVAWADGKADPSRTATEPSVIAATDLIAQFMDPPGRLSSLPSPRR